MVEFALENINQPIGVSNYRVTRELPAPIQDELPTVEDLRQIELVKWDFKRDDGKLLFNARAEGIAV
jgi:hypothetical protein